MRILHAFVLLSSVYVGSSPAHAESEVRGRIGTMRLDRARMVSLQGYAQLMEAHPDTALVTFQHALARAQAERTPESGGWWGLRLAYRLLGRPADAESVASRATPAAQPEVEFAQGWWAELDGDSLAAARHYATALQLDGLFTPPRLRLAQLRMRAGWRVEADSLLQQAAALGDTLAPAWRSRLILAIPPTPPESLLQVARTSAALTRLQLASLLSQAGQLRLPLKFSPPRLTHFHAVRDSLTDLAGSPWVSLARMALEHSGMELYPDGSFRPHDLVVRGAFALWLDRLTWDAPADSAVISDVAPGDYRRRALERAVRGGLLGVDREGRVAPGHPMTGPGAWAALRKLIPGLAER